jgi:hypothetical protein
MFYKKENGKIWTSYWFISCCCSVWLRNRERLRRVVNNPPFVIKRRKNYGASLFILTEEHY